MTTPSLTLKEIEQYRTAVNNAHVPGMLGTFRGHKEVCDMAAALLLRNWRLEALEAEHAAVGYCFFDYSSCQEQEQMQDLKQKWEAVEASVPFPFRGKSAYIGKDQQDERDLQMVSYVLGLFCAGPARQKPSAEDVEEIVRGFNAIHPPKLTNGICPECDGLGFIKVDKPWEKGCKCDHHIESCYICTPGCRKCLGSGKIQPDEVDS